MADLIARDGGREHGWRGTLTPEVFVNATWNAIRGRLGWGGGGGRNLTKLETRNSSIGNHHHFNAILMQLKLQRFF